MFYTHVSFQTLIIHSFLNLWINFVKSVKKVIQMKF